MVRVIAIVSALFVLSTAPLAQAGSKGAGSGGRLSRVGGGLRAGASSGSGGGSNGGGSGSGGHTGGSGGGGSTGTWGGPQHIPTRVHEDSPQDRPRGDVVVHTHVHPRRGRLKLPSIGLAGELYGGVQKLVESDSAYSLEGRLLVARTVGVVGRFSQFQERTDEMSTLKLDLWSVGATARLRVSPRLTLTPEIGLAGLEFRGGGFPSLVEVGVVGGVAARVRLAPGAALVGSAHSYTMTGASSALEVRAGVAAGPVQLAYRLVSFYEAGPPLEGPEVGVGFRF